jgi:hypothetical protein
MNDPEIVHYAIKRFKESKYRGTLPFYFEKFETFISNKYFEKYKTLDKIESIFGIYVEKEKFNNIDKFGGDFDLLIKINVY